MHKLEDCECRNFADDQAENAAVEYKAPPICFKAEPAFAACVPQTLSDRIQAATTAPSSSFPEKVLFFKLLIVIIVIVAFLLV